MKKDKKNTGKKKVNRMTLDELKNNLSEQVQKMGGDGSKHVRAIQGQIVIKSPIIL
jgi:hypothetical protein